MFHEALQDIRIIYCGFEECSLCCSVLVLNLRDDMSNIGPSRGPHHQNLHLIGQDQIT